MLGSGGTWYHKRIQLGNLIWDIGAAILMDFITSLQWKDGLEFTVGRGRDKNHFR